MGKRGTAVGRAMAAPGFQQHDIDLLRKTTDTTRFVQKLWNSGGVLGLVVGEEERKGVVVTLAREQNTADYFLLATRLLRRFVQSLRTRLSQVSVRTPLWGRYCVAEKVAQRVLNEMTRASMRDAAYPNEVIELIQMDQVEEAGRDCALLPDRHQETENELGQWLGTGRHVAPFTLTYTARANSWVSAFGLQAPNNPDGNGGGGLGQPQGERPLFDRVIADAYAPNQNPSNMWVVDGSNLFFTQRLDDNTGFNKMEFDAHGVITRLNTRGARNEMGRRTPQVPEVRAGSAVLGPVVVIFPHQYLWEGFIDPIPTSEDERNLPNEVRISRRLRRLYATLGVLHGNQYPVQFIDIELKKCQDRQDPRRNISLDDWDNPWAQANKYPCHDFEPRHGRSVLSACQVAKNPGDIKTRREPGYRKQHMYCEYDDAIMDGLVYYMRSRGGLATRISGDRYPTTDEAMESIWSEMETLENSMWVRTYKLERVQ